MWVVLPPPLDLPRVAALGPLGMHPVDPVRERLPRLDGDVQEPLVAPVRVGLVHLPARQGFVKSLPAVIALPLAKYLLVPRIIDLIRRSTSRSTWGQATNL